jgi:hypothetical protein
VAGRLQPAAKGEKTAGGSQGVGWGYEGWRTTMGNWACASERVVAAARESSREGGSDEGGGCWGGRCILVFMDSPSGSHTS